MIFQGVEFRMVLLFMFLSSTPTASTQAAPPTETGQRAPSIAIPTIESMASHWLDVAQITHMPSLHNYHEMAACAPDLLAVNYFPGRQLFVYPVTTRWYEYYSLPGLKFRINGRPYESTSCRWYPYQAVRRRTIADLKVETKVRMVFEGPGILYRVDVTNTSTSSQTVDLAIEVPGKRLETPNGLSVLAHSKDPAVEIVHACVQRPEQTQNTENAVVAKWTPTLAAGKSTTLQVVMAHSLEETPAPELAVEQATRAAERWVNSFDHVWADTKTSWSRRWHHVFTPDNPHFSGHLPTLVTQDKRISDIYYRSILTLLVLHRTNLKMSDRVFVTSGEREKGFVFYWDTSMWSKVFALLEPDGMKEQLRLFLRADPHGGFVYNMHTGEQGPGWYAANDMTMFRLVNSYLAVTGDSEFLKEVVGDRTVLEHMEKLATGWQALQHDKSVMLADYGENENLLECAPMYVHRIPSFNAANVWMMRTVADIYDHLGNSAKSQPLRHWADQIAAAVLDLYKSGDGIWFALHRDGKYVELRHCYDFVCVGKFMTDDLSRKIKTEMVDFVERELLTDKWMRAMSLSDKAAEISDRPDHGPMGAFDAWPALTADTMCELGAVKEAVDFVRGTHAVLYEGVFAQAHEFYGPNRLEKDAPVRIALRGACMRECVGGGAFAEMIIGAIFDFDPRYGKELNLRDATVDRGFEGELVDVKYHGKRFDLTSNENGVTIHDHNESK